VFCLSDLSKNKRLQFRGDKQTQR